MSSPGSAGGNRRGKPLGRAPLWPIIARNANDRVVSCEIAAPVALRALWEPVSVEARGNEWEAMAEEAVCSAPRPSRWRDADRGSCPQHLVTWRGLQALQDRAQTGECACGVAAQTMDVCRASSRGQVGGWKLSRNLKLQHVVLLHQLRN